MSDKLLQEFWKRAKEDDFFLASICEIFAGHRQWSHAELASHLECSQADLMRIGACRAPTGFGVAFCQEIERISQYGKCNADRLIALIREGSSLRSLARPDSHTSTLQAAKDRKKGDRNTEPTGNGGSAD